MKNKKTKRRFILLSIIILAFAGALGIVYFFLYFFPNSDIVNGFVVSDLPPEFTKNVFPNMLDLGKFFLTILIGVFVASLTFSEKIVNFSTSSWWAKSLLVLCWILLLGSIVCDGMGIVFLMNWYAAEMYSPTSYNSKLFSYSFLSFSMAGIVFGLALTSMLAAGFVSFVSQFRFLASDGSIDSKQPASPTGSQRHSSSWPPFKYKTRTISSGRRQVK